MITMKQRTIYWYPILGLIFLFVSNVSFSANRFWVGGTGNWNSTSSWSATSGGLSGASVPTGGDVAVFDGSNMTNCVIGTAVNVAGFSITTLYLGSISLNAGITMTVGSSGFSQAGGMFIGNTGNISVNGPFNLSAGIFTASAGTLQITGGYTFSGGMFNHNNGTVSFSTTQTITGSTVFNDILFVANGGAYTIAAATTLTALGNVTINGTASCAINTGTVALKGDLNLVATSNNSINGGSATFLFDGMGTQTINSSITSLIIGTNERMCALPNVEVNKMMGSLNLNGVITLNGTSWKTTSGASLINAGTSTVNIISAVSFTGQNLSLYDIHILPNGQAITLAAAPYKLISTHNVIINGLSYYQVNGGVLEILGDLTLLASSTSSINGGTGTFLFSGTGNQNINSSVTDLNNVCALPGIEINKTSGALNLNGIINFAGPSWNTIAGASLVNAGTSVVNLTKGTTISGQNLNFYDLVITGNFSTTTINSGVVWTSTHLLTFAGGASWYQVNTGTLNAKGDVLVTNTNTSGNVGGTALLLIDGTANQTLTGSGVQGGGRLPKVQINKTAGTLSLANPVISLDNNWTYMAGNVDAVSNASTLDFYKTSVIDGQGTSVTMTFNHVIFSGLISLGGNMDADGDFTIRNGVNNRLDVTSGNYQLNVGGNWTNNNSVTAASFNQQSGKVVFDGSTAQNMTLSATTDVEQFYNLEMNKTSAALTLNAPVAVSNNLNFISGKINSSATNVLTIQNNATASGASNSAFVSGPVCKTGNQAFIFPVGKNNVYAPISISAPAVNTNQFTAEYFQTNPNTLYSVTSKDVSLNHVSLCEYWILDRTSGTSNVSVTLSWDTRSCGVTNTADLRVARWNGTQWKDHGNGATTGSTSAGTILTSAAVTSFSPFTLASASLGNPLPIELIKFSARCEGPVVALDWTTASENNNDFFILERSTDAKNWVEIQKTDGAGNSNFEINYSFHDTRVQKGIMYYRLKQVDFDGNFSYSEIESVTGCSANESENALTVYPNPGNGFVSLAFTGNTDNITSVAVFTPGGERIYLAQNFESALDLSIFPKGVYFLKLSLGDEVIVQKIIIE